MSARYFHYVATLTMDDHGEKYSGRTSGIIERSDPGVTPAEVFKHIQLVTCQSLGVMTSNADLVVVELLNPIE